MAVPGWYTTWAETHRKTFVLSAEWVDAAELWWEIFESRGVTGSELTAATRDLMARTDAAARRLSDPLDRRRAAALRQALDGRAQLAREGAPEPLDQAIWRSFRQH